MIINKNTLTSLLLIDACNIYIDTLYRQIDFDANGFYQDKNFKELRYMLNDRLDKIESLKDIVKQLDT